MQRRQYSAEYLHSIRQKPRQIWKEALVAVCSSSRHKEPECCDEGPSGHRFKSTPNITCVRAVNNRNRQIPHDHESNPSNHLLFLITYHHKKCIHGGFSSVIPSVLKDLFVVTTNAATYVTQQICPATPSLSPHCRRTCILTYYLSNCALLLFEPC